MKKNSSPGFTIVSEWGTEAAAKKALAVAKKKAGALGLTYRKQFGKHLVVQPKRRNPGDEDAAAMYEEFHQKPSEYIEEIDYQSHERVHMAALGSLIELTIRVTSGDGFVLNFEDVTVACSPNGGQLYLVRGDQNIDLHRLGLGKTLPKDQLDIGEILQIVYETQKGFHNFRDEHYEHFFGEGDEKAGRPVRLPTLHFDALNRALYLSGGAYQVRPEGIVN